MTGQQLTAAVDICRGSYERDDYPVFTTLTEHNRNQYYRSEDFQSAIDLRQAHFSTIYAYSNSFFPRIDDWFAYSECEFAEAPTFINGAEYPGDETWLEKGKYTFSNAPTFIGPSNPSPLRIPNASPSQTTIGPSFPLPGVAGPSNPSPLRIPNASTFQTTIDTLTFGDSGPSTRSEKSIY